jgi:Ferritin-like domain
MAGREGVTRGGWFARGLTVCAGVASGGLVSAALSAIANSSTSQRDVDVLNFALAFEELQADFYARASRAAPLQGDWLRFAQVVGVHERDHVAFLRRALGSAAKPAPRLELARTPSSLTEFQRMAIGLEDIGVALYNGQAENVTPKTLAAAAEIVSVEARHAAWARDLAGEVPAPVATDVPASAEQVKAQLTNLGVKVG